MRLFAWITLAYAAIAVAMTLVFRDDTSRVASSLQVSSIGVQALLARSVIGLAAVLAFAAWRAGSLRAFAQRFLYAALALALCCVFMASFSSMKSLLPMMATALDLPHFFADPLFADLDKALHLGTDPWVFTHWATDALGYDSFIHDSVMVYGLIWVILALYLPVFVLFFEGDGDKARHYILLYAFCWVILGNAIALAGLSGGPVFYDRVFGTDRFQDLALALQAAGIEGSWYGGVQDFLWEAYTEMEQTAGSGISAFPSLHVAMMMVAALYMAEYGRIAQAIGLALVVATTFISVWTGYHYAIDGYASILLVLGAHWALKRRRAPAVRPAAVPGE